MSLNTNHRAVNAKKKVNRVWNIGRAGKVFRSSAEMQNQSA
jgi:hypothetical protein